MNESINQSINVCVYQWFPGYNSYRELVSCSNCTDYQSRAMEIRSSYPNLTYPTLATDLDLT
jgi:seryl-tRNA synthetase